MKARESSEAKFPSAVDVFDRSREKLEGLVSKLKGRDFEHAQHGEVEAWLVTEGRDLLRQLAQDHFDLRKVKEPKLAVVVGSEGTKRREVVEDENRAVGMVFGEVDIGRLVYRAPRKGVGNLMPLDLELNLPRGRFSFGMQRLAANEIIRSSFESAHTAIVESTGVSVSKGELEDMAAELAADFELFYAVGSEQARTGLSAILGSPDGIRSPDGLDCTKLLVMTTDASGVRVVMADLREATRIAAEIGANYVKSYYIDKGFERVVAGCPVPIVIAGGKKLPEREALDMAFKAIDQGAAGVDMGRNIFQSEAPVAMIKAIARVVHELEKPDKAFQLFNDLKAKG